MIKRANFTFLMLFILATLVSMMDAPRRAISASANSHTPLINQNEHVLFSFKVEKSEKVVTIAIGISNLGNTDYIVYRFGSKDKIELEFPSNKENSWEKFTYSYYSRGGGVENLAMDLEYLTFINGDYTYTIYYEYASEDGTNRVGIRVKNNSNNKEFNIKGDLKSIVGSLMYLRDYEYEGLNIRYM